MSGKRAFRSRPSRVEGYPSGQRGQTVNLLASPTEVQILPPPPFSPRAFPFGWIASAGFEASTPPTNRRKSAQGCARQVAEGRLRRRSQGWRSRSGQILPPPPFFFGMPEHDFLQYRLTARFFRVKLNSYGICGRNSVGRVTAFQAVGRGFDSRRPLHF
jgi:hypothetical protein